jgi:hypothetical protein
MRLLLRPRIKYGAGFENEQNFCVKLTFIIKPSLLINFLTLLVPTQQGVGTLAPNDLTPCRMAFYFVSTFAIAQTPTKQLALRLSRTKNLHFAKATLR